MRTKGFTILSSDEAKRAEEVFAAAVGRAVEDYGRAGGTLRQAEHSLLRYAAQVAIFEGRSEAKFVEASMHAHRTERAELRKRTKGSA